MSLPDHDFARELRVVLQERLLPFQLGGRRLHRAFGIGDARNQRVLARAWRLPSDR